MSASSTLIHTLPYAIVNAASPTIPVAAVAVMAIPGRGRRAIGWYLLGSSIVVLAATVLTLTVFANVPLQGRTRDLLPHWTDLALGVILLAIGVREWRRGPRHEQADRDGATRHKRARSFGELGPWAIVGVAMYMEAINLVTPPAYLAGLVVISEAKLGFPATAFVVGVNALVVLSPVWGLLAVSVLMPARTDAFLAGLQRLFHRYGHAALVGLLLVLGLALIARSGWALLR